MHQRFAPASVFFALLMLAASTACTKKEPACSYASDPKDIKVEWTAFKTMQKVPVKGSLPQLKVTGPSSTASLAELMKGLKVEIDATAIETGNPGRNVTIQEFFFGKLNPPFKLTASVDQVQGDDLKGTLQAKITMNGNAQSVPLNYQTTPDGSFSASGSIDILNFKANPAYDSLHQACEELHKGTDGVSKTWSTVDLSLSGKFKKNCR